VGQRRIIHNILWPCCLTLVDSLGTVTGANELSTPANNKKYNRESNLYEACRASGYDGAIPEGVGVAETEEATNPGI
jgi:hypothetical protein